MQNQHGVSEATYIKKSGDHRRKNKDHHSKKVQRIVSSVVVLICVAFLVMGGINLVSATSNAYVLTVDGEPIATMVSESEAREAIDDCLAEQSALFMDEYAYDVTYTNDVSIEEISAVGAVYSSIKEAAEALGEELDLVAMATAVLIDNRDTIFVANENAALEAVKLAKDHYGNAKEDEDVFRVYTSEQISITTATVDRDRVLTSRQAANMLIYGQPEATDEPQPMITVNVERERREQTVLPYQTVRVENPEVVRGTETTVTAGVDGVQEVTLLVTEVNGVITTSQQVDALVVQNAVDEVVEYGTKIIISSRGQNGTGEFGWPLAAGTGTITSRFGMRSLGWHSGLDVGDPVGTVIYAAEAGTVTFADYMSGYGLLLEIDHGNGVTTRYGHCDQTLVAVGDYVERGMSIGTIGMTGRTTGPHVHFEIRLDDVPVDPLIYLE